MQGRQREWKPISPQKRNRENVIKAIQLPMDCQDQKNEQIQKTEEKDWRNDEELSYDYNTYRVKISNMLSELQHIWHGQTGQIKATKHGIELNSAEKCSIHSSSYRAGPPAREFEE